MLPTKSLPSVKAEPEAEEEAEEGEEGLAIRRRPLSAAVLPRDRQS